MASCPPRVATVAAVRAHRRADRGGNPTGRGGTRAHAGACKGNRDGGPAPALIRHCHGRNFPRPRPARTERTNRLSGRPRPRHSWWRCPRSGPEESASARTAEAADWGGDRAGGFFSSGNMESEQLIVANPKFCVLQELFKCCIKMCCM